MPHPRETLSRRLDTAPDVVWHEPAPSEHTGEPRGADAVLRMHEAAMALAGGTFRRKRRDVLASDEPAVALVLGSARRDGRALGGREVGVHHGKDGRVTEASLHPDDGGVVRAFREEGPRP